MYRKLLTLILAVLLLNLLSVTPATAGTRSEELKFKEKVKGEKR